MIREALAIALFTIAAFFLLAIPAEAGMIPGIKADESRSFGSAMTVLVLAVAAVLIAAGCELL